jgi:exopolyphosphatase/guanosine-5'-triphosphate,3'-diphosphate pyrophosphatase
MQTISAIDVGSNAIRMAVGRISANQDRVEVMENIRIPVRLGQDVFSQGHIGEPSMQAAVDAFTRFHKITSEYEVKRIRAVATSAMREAENGQDLIERILRRTGIQVEIISGEEEARLIHIAVGKVIDLRHKKTVLIDIGGGSIEVAVSQGNKLIASESYDMGTVRLLQNLEDRSPQDFRMLLEEYTQSIQRHIKRELGKLKFDLCVGTGGNIEELGNLRKKVFKRAGNDLITVSELETLDEKISKMSMDQRIKKLNLKPDRADVIVPAAMVLRMIAREARVREIHIPGVGLKDGILWDMTPLLPGSSLPRRDQARISAMRLGHKYHFDGEHGVSVARTAQSIFDQTVALHELGEEEKLLLEIASILHDIGHFIGMLKHDQHGYYILKNSPLIGLDERGQNIVAQIVRSHRKMTVSGQDPKSSALTQKDRGIASRLCALLRLADAIEISHTARIHDVRLTKAKKGWQLHLHGDGNLLLERWAIDKRKGLFEDIFGTPLSVL